MAQHRYYHEELTPGSVRLSPAEARHAVRILRVRQGDKIDLFDGRGRAAVGIVTEATRSRLIADVENVAESPRPVGTALALFAAMPRGPRQHVLFEKCTELGVARIVPTLFDRGTVRPKEQALSKWRRIAIEAGKQCGCFHLPHIEPPTTFEETLTLGGEVELPLVGAVGPDFARLADVIRESQPTLSAAVWIGPEGGLTEEESAALAARGVTPVSFGPHVLRIETAAIAAAATFASIG